METMSPNPFKPFQEDVQGIPSFWLTIFKNVEMLAEMVQDHDEPILEKLEDVTVKIHEKPAMGFTINFHFQVGQRAKKNLYLKLLQWTL